MKKLISAIIATSLLATAGAFTISVNDAAAKPAKEKKTNADLSASLGSLTWGMSSDKAKTVIGNKIMDDFRTKSYGNTDLSYVDNLRKTHTDRVENMQKSYTNLSVDNSAMLSVSIVGEEFMPDAGESMLTSREDIATKYYFFKDDKLYKMAVVYDSAYIGPIAFDTFVATTAQKYGPATEELWDDDGNFTDAIWKDKSNVTLTVKNKYQSYSTFLMVFADESVEKPLHAKHMAYFEKMNSGPEVSAAIDSLTEDDPSGGNNSVDAILGKKTEVNLMAGLSQEDIDIINGVTTKEEIEKKKAKAKKKAAKQKKSDAKAKAGLTIY